MIIIIIIISFLMIFIYYDIMLTTTCSYQLKSASASGSFPKIQKAQWNQMINLHSYINTPVMCLLLLWLMMMMKDYQEYKVEIMFWM